MQSAIELNDVRFSWLKDGQPVIDIGCLSLARSERLFLRGPSGSGKTTLLSLVAGINTPESGVLKVLDTSLPTMTNGQRDQFRADHIGFVFQLFNLIPYLNVRDNVLLPLRFSRQRQKRCANATDEAVQLLEHLGLRGDVLEAIPSALSVGQQQRVAAARALIGKPDIVIADEPTSSLDADNREQFIELLMRECEESGAALLFVSHDNSLAKLFDRCVNLSDINRARASDT